MQNILYFNIVIFRIIGMSQQLYRKFLNLLKEWPINEIYKERFVNLFPFLLKQYYSYISLL